MKRGSPEEIWFFGRTSGFAIVIATIYAFYTRDTFGTVLLYGFGIASGVAAVVLWMELRRARQGLPSNEERQQETIGVPFSDEAGRVPQGSLAPLGVGLGVGLACFGLVFGPWLILLGGVIALASGRDWLRDISREWDAVERADRSAVRGGTHPSGR